MMKRYIVIFGIIIAFTGTRSDAQINTYLQNNPVWKCHSGCAIPLPCVKNDTYNYYLQGDTVINSLTYKQVFRKGEGYYFWSGLPPAGCSGTFSYVDTTASYFIRSSGKQMYLKQPFDTTEYLLYDFDLNVGDTLPMSFNNLASDVTVTAIDSFFTPNGFYHKFTLAGNTWSQYLIEGVGHSNGLFEPLNLGFDCGYELLCFGLNDTAYYPASGPTCLLPVGVDDEINDYSLEVYPNPFKELTTIYSSKTINNAVLSIYNMQGQLVMDKIFDTTNKIVINGTTLGSGIFVYELRDGTTFISRGKLLRIE